MVLGHPPEVGLKSEFGLLLAVRRTGGGLLDGRDHLLADIADECQVEVLLRVEVLVENRFGDSCCIGDIVHRGAMKAPSCKHLNSDIQNLFAAFAGR